MESRFLELKVGLHSPIPSDYSDDVHVGVGEGPTMFGEIWGLPLPHQ